MQKPKLKTMIRNYIIKKIKHSLFDLETQIVKTFKRIKYANK